MSLTESETSDVAAAWDRYATAYQKAVHLPTDVVSYGPNVGTEADFKLLGPVSGKRIVDLGCGGGQSVIALAKQGATAIGIDISPEQISYARRLAEQEELRVELKKGNLAELAFQQADSMDIVFSAFAFQYVPDLNRVFRQAHRILKPGGTLLFSLPHPARSMTSQTSTVIDKPAQLSLDPEPVAVKRSYFDRSPLSDTFEQATFVEYHRTVSDLFMGLVRSGYRVDLILEPENAENDPVPHALILRARKEA